MTTIATTFLGAVLAAEETDFDPASVTPGVIGFAVTALFALAVILLGIDLVRRIRRSQYRAEIAEELRAELAERDGDPDIDPDIDPAADPGTGPEK